ITVTESRYAFCTPELQLLSETADSTAAAKPIAFDYVWFGGEPLAQIETATGEVSFYFNDHLGTPVLTAGTSANVAWRVEREPYGNVVAFRASADKHQPLAFPGQEEGEGDIAYNVFRWYKPYIGRYATSDPIGLRGGINLYAYVQGNPIKAYDRFGLQLVMPPSTPTVSGCTISLWQIESRDATPRPIGPLMDVYSLTGSAPLQLPMKGDAITNGECACFYELTGVEQLQQKTTVWKATKRCQPCGISETIRSYEVHEAYVKVPAILPSPPPIRVAKGKYLAPFDVCVCPPSLRE
ncbi:MAG: RHS repeat domain-containing protein, partial [Thermoanaerobaculia bacterium]